MAIEAVTNIVNDLYAVEILASAIATNSAPASLTAGCSVETIRGAFGGHIPDDLSLLVVSTAGSSTMSCTLRLWGKFGILAGLTSIGAWAPLGTGADATKGTINAGSALGETGTDVIRHVEPISLTAHMERLYVEITAISGTSTAITVFLVGRRRIGRY